MWPYMKLVMSLGFVSGVDDPGWLNAVQAGQAEGKGKIQDQVSFATPLDLFRYSQNAKGDRRDLSIGRINGKNPFFSIDGGETPLADFSSSKQKELGGDGYQASHWAHSPDNPIGILDPVLLPGEERSISSLDLLAFDVIGWDLHRQDATVEAFDLPALAQDAKTELARQLNVDEQWLDENPEQAADLLNQDRDEDVVQLIEDSEIYEWGRSRRSRGTNSRWQEVIDLLTQEGFFASTESVTGRTSPVAQASVDPLLGIERNHPLVRDGAAEPPGNPENDSSIGSGSFATGAASGRTTIANNGASQTINNAATNQSFDPPLELEAANTLSLGLSSISDTPLLQEVLASEDLFEADPLLAQGAEAIIAYVL